jgi:hypothetical protein
MILLLTPLFRKVGETYSNLSDEKTEASIVAVITLCQALERIYDSK